MCHYIQILLAEYNQKGEENMKKIISLLLSATMLSATVASAATYNSKEDILSGLGITDPAQQAAIDNHFDFEVEADIKVRKAGEANYVDGPIVVEKATGQTFPKFDFKASFNMQPVWQTMYDFVDKGKSWLGAASENDLKAVPVAGTFTIEINCPKSLSIPAGFRSAASLAGFTDNVKQAFEEVSRDYDSLNGKLTIVVKLKGSTTCGTLMGYYDPSNAAKSADFELECEDLQPSDFGTYTVKGAVTGSLTIGNPVVDGHHHIATVAYNAVQSGTHSNDTLSATITVNRRNDGTVGGGTGGGIYIPPTTSDGIKIEFDINGNRDIIKSITGATSVVVNYDQIKPAAIEGMTFDGWYLDPAFTTKFTVEGTVMTNLVLYGRYVITDAPEVFDDAHKAYIKGYPDGTVQPMGLITREEITTALYRLLKDSVVEKITTTENNYSDVEADRWSVTSISSMTKGGYIKGYEDGTFRPANDITRAEFATLVLRFFADTNAITGGDKFIDIDSHWAEENIIKAEAMGLFNGYEDGTFRPDAYITRAEAMAVINRITVRRANNNSFVGNFINWPDISTSNWYYADVIEATNTHNFTRIDELMNEQWTDVSYTDLIVG